MTPASVLKSRLSIVTSLLAASESVLFPSPSPQMQKQTSLILEYL